MHNVHGLKKLINLKYNIYYGLSEYGVQCHQKELIFF